ncbi:MAG: glycosyl hydrolase family 28 protein [Thermoguttaceae bacterium]|nr:glycosyl hydrolase family 28 protein [Thermoguttaceae bacterium]
MKALIQTFLLATLVAVAAMAPTFAFAQILEDFDQWRADEIQKDRKIKKDWQWVLKLPSPDHFPTYTVKVNGKKYTPVKFEELSYLDIPTAKQFDFEIAANVPIKQFNISPHSYGIKGELHDNVLKFSIDRPRKLIVTLNTSHRLLLFANGPEKFPVKPDDAKVIRLADYHVDATGQKDETTTIQKAIDDTAKIQGTLYISKGTYCITQLFMRSNTTLYLQRGATLKLSSDKQKQSEIIADNLQKGIQFIAPIMINKVHDVRICGYGTIDGNGVELAQKTSFAGRGRYRLVHSLDSENIQIVDVILKNPQRWNTHLANTDNILLENIKIVNSINICNTDAIDPDNARNVLIRDVFAYSGDDSVVVKTSARWHDEKRQENQFIRSANIKTCDCVFWTAANALKIGTETFRDIDNVLFENNDVLHASCALTIEIKEGSKTSHVKFINNRVETLNNISSISSGRVLNFLVRNYIYTSHKATMIDRPSYGQLTDVLVKDVVIEKLPDKQGRSNISGFNETTFIHNIVFDNFVIQGKKVTDPKQFNARIGNFVEGLKFQ